MADRAGVFRNAAMRTGCIAGVLLVAVSFIGLFLAKIDLAVMKHDLLRTHELVRIR